MYAQHEITYVGLTLSMAKPLLQGREWMEEFQGLLWPPYVIGQAIIF